MIDIQGLKQRLAGLSDISKPEQRLQAARGLLKDVTAAERTVAMNFDISFDIVSRLKELIPEVQNAAERAERSERRCLAMLGEAGQ